MSNFRLLGFKLSFDSLIFVQFVQNKIWSKMLSFVRFLRSFYSNTRVRNDLLETIGYKKFVDTIKRSEMVGNGRIFCQYIQLDKTMESQMISANI